MKHQSPFPNPFSLAEDRFGLGQVHATPGRGGEVAQRWMDAEDGEPEAEHVQPAMRTRRWMFAVVFSVLAGVVGVGRVSWIATAQGEDLRLASESNRYQSEYFVPRRGIIRDRFGRLLAQNVPTFSLTMTARELPAHPDEQRAVIASVAQQAGLNPSDIDLLRRSYADVPNEPIVVTRELEYTQAMRLLVDEPHTPGFRVSLDTRRQYGTTSPSLSHVLGYVGKMNVEEYAVHRSRGYRRVDEIGKTGVEQQLELVLRGQPGRRVVETDARGQEKTLVAYEPPTAGSELTLTIDADLQAAAETSLRDALGRTQRTTGTVIAMDPSTGEVHALVSLPTYDANVFARGIDTKTYHALIEDPTHPLFFRAVSGEYPSGSTFKPFVAAAALAEGLITPTTSFLSVGGLRIGPWFFPDWKAGGHGVTNVTKAIAESVNTFFYTIGGGYDRFAGLGVERITSYASQFGFGSKTGIELPAEADGFLPSKAWKEETKGERWYVGDTYHLAIGQGDLLVTPIQMAAGVSAIANGGRHVRPTLVLQIDGDPQKTEGQDLSDALVRNIPIVQTAMRETVRFGSARRLSVLSLPASGKTGTAQGGGTRDPHAWFVGYLPSDKPQLVLVVLVEEGGEGSSVAVPIAEEVFSWWIRNRALSPDPS